MRKGLILSFFLHVFVFFIAWVNVPDLFLPKEEIKSIQVKLVTAKNVKKTTEVKKQVKPKKTQQSAAPKAPVKPKPKPEPKPKPKPKPEKKAPTVVQEPKKVEKKVAKPEPVKKPEPKKEPEPAPAPVVPEPPKEKAPEPKKEEPKPPKVEEVRPPLLDKSEKENVLKKEPEPMKEEEPVEEDPLEDDFMKALSFVEDLEAEEEAMFEGEEMTEKTTINLADQTEIAALKRHIEKHWNRTPGTVINNQLIVSVNINRDGTLDDVRVVQSSGNRALDRSLKRAIRRAAPLPFPAEKYDTFKEMDFRFVE